MPTREGWDYAQLKSDFLADIEFQRLARIAPDHLTFLAAIGLWTIGVAQGWRDDDPDVSDLLTDDPELAALLERAGLVKDGHLKGFAKWTEKARVAREHGARRHAMNANEHLTTTIRARDGDACRYCAKTVNWRDRRSVDGGTYDHVQPISRGGTETVENLVVCCRGCNSRKSARTPEEAGMVLLDLAGPIRFRPDLSGSRQEVEVEVDVEKENVDLGSSAPRADVPSGRQPDKVRGFARPFEEGSR